MATNCEDCEGWVEPTWRHYQWDELRRNSFRCEKCESKHRAGVVDSCKEHDDE